MELNMLQKFHSSNRGPLALATVLMLVWASLLNAQPTDGEFQAKLKEFQSLQQSLESVRKQTMADNPELQRRQSSLQDQMMSLVRDEGVLPRKRIRRLQDMARSLRSGEMSEDEQAAMRESYREMSQELLDARRAALQDEQMKSAQLEFIEDREAAMTEVDADVPAMLERSRTLRQELAAMQRSRRGSGMGAE